MTSDGIHGRLTAILETDDVRVINDIGNTVYDYRKLAGKRLTITSVRERKSHWRGQVFAEAGFTSEETGPGLIRPGGTVGRYLLQIELYKLPVTMILREAGISRHGDMFYKWERV